MRDVSAVEMNTTMLGKKMSFPVYISGAAKGGLGHADAEVALCKAAAAYGTLQMCPHMATKTLEQMAEARAKGQSQFLQLYVEKDRAASEDMVKRADALGFSGLFLTVRSFTLLHVCYVEFALRICSESEVSLLPCHVAPTKELSTCYLEVSPWCAN